MSGNKQFIMAMCLTPLFFIGCGEGAQRDAEPSALNGQNYLKVAKGIYAQQTGERSSLEKVSLLPPGASIDEETLYLKQVKKFSAKNITSIEAQQGSNSLTIQIDNESKYATVTLSGNDNQNKMVNLKDFTVLDR